VSIKADPPVAVVEKNAKRHGTETVARAYLEFLYSDEAQDIIARNFYRPTADKAAKAYAATFPAIKLFTIDEVFGGWSKAQATHFADGGIFDRINARK
jgi:sulfate transport system substrate-binding protein